MPRRARQESRTDLYHIIMRGNNKNWIFRKEAYKQKMRSFILQQEDCELLDLYAWCIMDNHVHLVAKASKEKMSEAMRNINRNFAMFYNFKEKTVGHVFENRYKSEAVVLKSQMTPNDYLLIVSESIRIVLESIKRVR